MLKLVINNTQPYNKEPSFQSDRLNNASLTIPPQDPFLIHSRQIAHNLYTFSAHDSGHGLFCEMNVEIKESYTYSQEAGEERKYLVPMAFCNFPNIDTQRLNKKVCWDEYLQGSIMVQFQLKILEQLLLFCDEKDATHLILTINDVNDDYIEIYRPFALSEEQVITTEGEQTEIVISIDVETYDEAVDFMDKFDMDFQKTLWFHQKANPIFRKYLIDHSLSVPQ